MQVRDVLEHAVDQLVELVGRSVADGVGDVERRGTGVDDGLQRLIQVFALRARGVHWRELHVLAVRLRTLDYRHRLFHGPLAGHAKLAAEVDVGGRNKRVNSRPLGVAHGLGAAIDVFRSGAGEPGDDRALYVAGNAADGFEVVRRRDRKARLDDVDAEARELVRDLHLLVGGQRGPRRLLAVP